MSAPAESLTIDDLSRTIPIFPLRGVLLLPRALLPLNVFEPRYLAMTRDALGTVEATGRGLIGMIQPTEPERGGQRPDLYRIGCLGEIAGAAETEDGRILITLRGICRFHVARELEAGTLYRQVDADYAAFAADLEVAPDGICQRDRLLKALQAFCDRQGLPADWDSINTAPDDLLVHSLAMVCPFSAGEKQALLEAPDFAARAEMLITLMEMAVLEPGGPPFGRKLN
ncbi:LON peptidase substrate-binding domain-containing protein [Ferrovibrio xuzhouensis]|uniref:LON peptidase substrate-binding domain-containing protein n=1 Tax=Ferrovibrio xuzhouensis TaxID=1576914 RepID=A0ABV7VE94_9PROT